MASTKKELVKELWEIYAELPEEDPARPKIMEIIELAKEGYYHDFESPEATPKMVLVKHLRNIGVELTDLLAEQVRDGEFDE